MKRLNVKVVIDNKDVSDHVIGLERHHNICEVTAFGVLYLSPGVNIKPYDKIVIWERGTKTFTGYVTRINTETDGFKLVVDFSDCTVLLYDYWLVDKYKTNGETVLYWIDFFCDLVGVDHTFDTDLPVVLPAGEEGIEFQYSSVMDVIKHLMDINGYWCYTTADGVLHFSQGHPVRPTLMLNKFLSLRREKTISTSRNKAVVFGRYPLAAEATKYMPELAGVYKTAIVASPTILDPQTIANKLVKAFARVQDRKIVEVEGDPNITLAKFARIEDGWSDLARYSQVTGVDVFMNEDGYKMRVTLDQECPKVWGPSNWEPLSSGNFLVAFDKVVGCHVLTDYWEERNNGASGIFDNQGGYDPFWNSKQNSIDPEDAILWRVQDGLVYRSEDCAKNWSGVYMPDPINVWNDLTPPTVEDVEFLVRTDNIFRENEHYILARYRDKFRGWRGWFYKTVDDGFSWETMPLNAMAGNLLVNGDFDYSISGWSVYIPGARWALSSDNDGSCQFYRYDYHSPMIYQNVIFPGSGYYTFSMDITDWASSYYVHAVNLYIDSYTSVPILSMNQSDVSPKSTTVFLNLTGQHTIYIWCLWFTYNPRLDVMANLKRVYISGSGISVPSQVYPIWMDTDTYDGSHLYVTIWKPDSPTRGLYLQRYSSADLSLEEEYLLAPTKLEDTLGYSGWGEVVYPRVQEYTEDVVYVYGKVNDGTEREAYYEQITISGARENDAGSNTIITGGGFPATYITGPDYAVNSWYPIDTMSTDDYISHDMGSAVAVRKMGFRIGTPASSIVWKIQYSDDDSTWYDTGATITFNKTNQYNEVVIPDVGAHRYWALRYVSGSAGSHAWIHGVRAYIYHEAIPRNYIQILKSLDGGLSFYTIENTWGQDICSVFTCSASGEKYAVRSTASGLAQLYYTYSGEVLSYVSDINVSGFVYPDAFTQSATEIAVGAGSGVFESQDGGMTWTDLNYPGVDVRSLIYVSWD